MSRRTEKESKHLRAMKTAQAFPQYDTKKGKTLRAGNAVTTNVGRHHCRGSPLRSIQMALAHVVNIDCEMAKTAAVNEIWVQ